MRPCPCGGLYRYWLECIDETGRIETSRLGPILANLGTKTCQARGTGRGASTAISRRRACFPATPRPGIAFNNSIGRLDETERFGNDAVWCEKGKKGIGGGPTDNCFRDRITSFLRALGEDRSTLNNAFKSVHVRTNGTLTAIRLTGFRPCEVPATDQSLPFRSG